MSTGQKIRLAGFGAGGWNTKNLATFNNWPDVELVAVADVNQLAVAATQAQYPEVVGFQDYRQLLSEYGSMLDAVIIATPDHMHAPMAAAAMQCGLAVYLEKPLTHTVYEARQLSRTAKERKLVTQMGIQVHASSESRTAVHWIQSGVIGQVKEVHVWCSNTWGDEGTNPTTSDPVPPTLDWDGWLGVAEYRPYIKGYYTPYEWRRRVDFGSGTLGDKGCHLFDPLFQALSLTSPLSICSDSIPPGDSWHPHSRVNYVFPATPKTVDTLPVYWYGGEHKPPQDFNSLFDMKRLPAQGSICVGTEGSLMLVHADVAPVVVGGRPGPRPVLPAGDHYRQFLDAIQGQGKTTADFEFSGPLTEAVLLGCIALRFPGVELHWDAETMTFPNHSEANFFVHKTYRKGWEVPGILGIIPETFDQQHGF